MASTPTNRSTDRTIPADLSAENQELLKATLEAYPELSTEKALRMLKAFGAL